TNIYILNFLCIFIFPFYYLFKYSLCESFFNDILFEDQFSQNGSDIHGAVDICFVSHML
ncbi:hypothetical protein ACJX0J_014874, partial [Zea mays]